MRIEFVKRDNGPKNLAAEAELHFGEGEALEGCKIVGITLWRSVEGEVFVTFPAREFKNQAGERKFADYLRATNDIGPLKVLKAQIIEAYQRGRS
jgi:hypothetical protein